MADQSYLVKIVLIAHCKYSQADIAYNYVNRSKAEQHTLTNVAHSNNQMAERKHPIYMMVPDETHQLSLLPENAR